MNIVALPYYHFIFRIVPLSVLEGGSLNFVI